MDENLRKLVEWIAESIDVEPMSGLMYESPIWNVDATELLDQIAVIWDLSPDEVGAIVNPIRKQIEEKRRHGASSKLFERMS